jgi:hypothetical protein
MKGNAFPVGNSSKDFQQYRVVFTGAFPQIDDVPLQLVKVLLQIRQGGSETLPFLAFQLNDSQICQVIGFCVVQNFGLGWLPFGKTMCYQVVSGN